MNRRRQLPYHMHIPLEHLDAAHLIAAFILEVPNMLLQQLTHGYRRLVSRALRKYLDSMEKNLFLTPPETNREYILHAALAVGVGDWQKAFQFLTKIRFLSEMIDVELYYRSNEIQAENQVERNLHTLLLFTI